MDQANSMIAVEITGAQLQKEKNGLKMNKIEYKQGDYLMISKKKRSINVGIGNPYPENREISYKEADHNWKTMAAAKDIPSMEVPR